MAINENNSNTSGINTPIAKEEKEEEDENDTLSERNNNNHNNSIGNLKPEVEEETGENDADNDNNIAGHHGEEYGYESEEYDDDNDDEEDDDDDDDDREPALKYKRFGPNINTILERDAASAITVSEKFLVVGTHWGKVYILDYEGNEVKSWTNIHNATVNCVSIDADNEFVASASDDGRVVINGLYVDEKVVADYRRPIKAVALDPRYKKSSRRRFVSGGMSGELVMREAKWRSNKYFIVHSGEGQIGAIKWQGDFIAWANDEGVRIYNSKTELQVAHIERPPHSPRPDLYKPHLEWNGPDSLIIGWGNFVQVVTIDVQKSYSMGTSGLSSAVSLVSGVTGGGGNGSSISSTLPDLAEIRTVFKTDFVVCGVVKFKEKFLVLSYDTDLLDAGPEAEGLVQVSNDDDSSLRRDASPPEMRIIDENLDEICSDMLEIDGYALYQANDYMFVPICRNIVQGKDKSKNEKDETSAEDQMWFILSPKQLIVVKPRGLKDHIEWLQEREMYIEALTCIDEAKSGSGEWARFADEIEPTQYLEIGNMGIYKLIEAGDYAKAASICSSVLSAQGIGDTKDKWEEYVFSFAECHALQNIAPYMPTESPKLSNTVYEMTIAFFLTSDTEQFYKLVQMWPHSIYDSSSVIIAAESQLSKAPEDENIKKALAQLYDCTNQPNKSLKYHLELHTPGVITRIKRENLYGAIQNKIVLLMENDKYNIIKELGDIKDEDDDKGQGEGTVEPTLKDFSQGEGVQLIADNPDAISPQTAVKQLIPVPSLLHVYLHVLLDKDPQLGAPFADLQVELYAEYNPELLLSFLRISNYYYLAKAFEICEMRDLVPEMVYLLGRMGDNHRALQLIIDQMGDVHKAIEFAKEQNDPDVWKDLLQYSKDKPEFIVALLKQCGNNIDTIRLIKEIPDGLEILGLKEALYHLFQDKRWNLDMARNCSQILENDSSALVQTSRSLRYRGINTAGADLCLLCQKTLDDMDQSSNILAFWCGHSFHDACLLHPDVIRKTDLLPQNNSRKRGQSGVFYSLEALYQKQSAGHLNIFEKLRKIVQDKMDKTLQLRQFGPPICPICSQSDSHNGMSSPSLSSISGTRGNARKWSRRNHDHTSNAGNKALKASPSGGDGNTAGQLSLSMQQAHAAGDNTQNNKELPPMVSLNI
ncbi:Vacuolar protein sorting-associated protein 41 [Mycoemilia scoparia]|uniref:Vacuolar protein sorting-associated protein 41 n=1 Tax=Mycoemilia scoparia TaxID=417184 RepID=A0A9W7ZWK9_9FUNG|nr:Vacuolar protein sorting-associated protein 41 [Mycoemilia scoparia]